MVESSKIKHYKDWNPERPKLIRQNELPYWLNFGQAKCDELINNGELFMFEVLGSRVTTEDEIDKFIDKKKNEQIQRNNLILKERDEDNS